MAELGETADPRALVPGDPEAARAMARSMTAFAGSLHEAGDALGRITTPEGWTGEAADAFRQRFALQPSAWQDAGDAFTAASRALDIYAETLDWAQRQATDAARAFGAAQAVSQQAGPAPVDPGEPGRQQARDVLNRARGELTAAGDAAAQALDQAAETAPTSTGFWDDVGEVLADAGRDVVNATASLGNAALHHPADVAAMLGGAGLVLLGGLGELGGGALDITGAALAGVPLNIASAGVIATGAGIAGAGAISMAMSAAGEDRVEPLGSDGGEPPPPPIRPAAQQPQGVTSPRLQNILNELYRGTRSPARTGDGTTADAIRWERASGRTVEGKRHIQKGVDSIRALKRWLRQNPHASAYERGIAQNELSNLLDALGRTN